MELRVIQLIPYANPAFVLILQKHRDVYVTARGAVLTRVGSANDMFSSNLVIAMRR